MSESSGSGRPKRATPHHGRPPATRRPRRLATAVPADPARRAAYDLLHEVGAQGAYANLALPALLRRDRLTGRDAAFATELAFGTLRWQGLYDEILGACLDRPLPQADPRVRDLLRLGCHQVLGMRVPPHAAVATTVDLARDVAGDGAARLGNAVLRQVLRRSRDEWVAAVAPDRASDPAGHLAVAWSHPRWIVSALHDVLGGSWDATQELLRTDNEAAAVTLVARPGALEPAALQAIPGVEPGRWSPYAGRLAHGAPHDLDVVANGRAGVQDEGSQLVALALAAAAVDGPDACWLDLCAGPGGKAALLAGLVAARGGSLTAVEPQPHRAALVRGALRAMPGRHEVIEADGRDRRWPPGTFDRVLADVPCTGLGVLRRRPEARWRRTPGDVAALGPLQRQLLAAALDAVRPGGVVAYATCSPHLAETELVVADVLRARPDAVLTDARALLPSVPQTGPGPFLRLWPQLHGTDGMFLAVIRRTD
ncbi:MAG: rRNA cytosine-C5-methyltransferase [Actinomycetota bacterium]|nr:MAG: rRNA cytosine-C5-methyltransferase [Actinomycetota bacterium]